MPRLSFPLARTTKRLITPAQFVPPTASDREMANPAMSSSSDCPRVYMTSTHREDIIDTGFPLPPPCQPSWGFHDPSLQTGYPAYDTQSTEYSMGYGAEMAGQHLEPYPKAYSGAVFPQQSVDGFSFNRYPGDRIPNDLQHVPSEIISRKMFPPGSTASAFSTPVIPNASDTSESPSSIPVHGTSSTNVLKRRTKPRSSRRRNTGNMSAAHCDLEGFARYRVRDYINKHPDTDVSEVIERSLTELKSSAVRAKIHTRTLCCYQRWAAKRARVDNEEVQLCILCFKTYGVLLPVTAITPDEGAQYGCRCARVNYKMLRENNQRESKDRLHINEHRQLHPKDKPVDLD
jgi:hypothetical protein